MKFKDFKTIITTNSESLGEIFENILNNPQKYGGSKKTKKQEYVSDCCNAQIEVRTGKTGKSIICLSCKKVVRGAKEKKQ